MRRLSAPFAAVITGLLLAPAACRAASLYVACDFTGGIQGSYVFELEQNADQVSGVAIVAPNLGTMQLDRATNGQLIAHMRRSVAGHPDAVFTVVVNRITGKGSAFYSPPWKDSLELFLDVAYQKGEGDCRKVDRAF